MKVAKAPRHEDGWEVKLHIFVTLTLDGELQALAALPPTFTG
jgi:hypothetical protein